MKLFHLFSKKKEEKLNSKDVISPIETPIERVKSLADIIALAWNKLDADVLAPHLSDNIQYNSVWVDNTIKGKAQYLDYLKDKFDTLRTADELPLADVINENGKEIRGKRETDR